MSFLHSGGQLFVRIVEAGLEEPGLTQKSDKELVAACQDGHKAAYEVLVERHYGRVFGLCLGLLSHGHAAEDVAQEAFLKGLEQIAELCAGAAVRG